MVISKMTTKVRFFYGKTMNYGKISITLHLKITKIAT